MLTGSIGVIKNVLSASQAAPTSSHKCDKCEKKTTAQNGIIILHGTEWYHHAECLGEKALKTLPDEKSALLFFHIPVCTENKKALVLKDKCDFSKILYQAAVFHKVLFRGGMCVEMAVIDR